MTGYHVHRGALASMQRAPLPAPEQLLAPNGRTDLPRRIAVFEDIVDHTNLGAAFRSAAALGVDAVLVTPRCADPLYRRSVKVSMGAVFQVPWTRTGPWPDGIGRLREHGYLTAALALDEDAVDLDALAARRARAPRAGLRRRGRRPATRHRGSGRPDRAHPDGARRRLAQRRSGLRGGLLRHSAGPGA